MDEIRKTWAQIGSRFENRSYDDAGNTGGDYNSYDISRRTTALDRLKRKYLQFSRLALVFIFVWPCTLINLHDIVGEWRIPLTVLFCTYFAICSAMDYWLYKGICSIDCYTMTVKEVVDKAYYYRKMHLRFIATLLPIAFICVGTLGWVFRSDPALICGMIVGGVLGLAVGYRHYLDFMSEYRRIRM